MTTLNAAGFLLRPFTAADAPNFAAAVRESFATVGKWMPWATADYTEDATVALAEYAFGPLAQSRVEIVVAAGNTASFALALKADALHEGLARNRIKLGDKSVSAHVFSLIP